MRISVACANQRAFVGSQNFSATSLDANREVGVIVADPAMLAQLVSVAQSDWPAAQADE
jgi:phosphatidylserine/phosphatidylglycerophosphate/cardiolipin synthase-like enzyme